MNRPELHCLLCVAFSWLACPASAQVVQEYEYQKDRIYEVRTGLGITTQIELSPNEKILDFSTGFSAGWDLTRRENVFYLKPKNVDVDTNMVVRTATQSYIFELKVVATDWTALSLAWDLTRRENVDYLRPTPADVAAHMGLRTSTTSDIFELKVAATDWCALSQAQLFGVQYWITFDYANDASHVCEA